MFRTRFVGLTVLFAGLVAPGLRADDAKPAIKTGGNFAVETVKDIPYYEGDDADPNKHKLDLYLPKGQKDFPVLFFVHGGSWRSGDRKPYAPLGTVFAQNGVGAVIISYRLTPKVQHPEHIKDVARAFAWTVNNIAKHGGQPDQIFASGHSAGGHLVSLLGTDESYLKAQKLSFANLKGVIPISGVYTILPNNKIFEPAFGTDEETVKNASPLRHVHENLVPFCIFYADKDYLTLDKNAEQMCKALKDCKCEASLTCIKDRDHTSIIRQAVKEDDPTTQAILEFIAKHSNLKLTAKK